ncbi:Tryptophan synthase alpha chain [Minicystis rosea]|nr:Tryptophan synthase alpha chain [Minicystis rosea]
MICTPGAEESCYSGPSGTEGKGLCKAGIRTCNAAGTAFGACEGEVGPAQEQCYGGLDRDCDGKNDDEGPGGSTCGALGWNRVFGSATGSRGDRILTDADGNVIVAGTLTPGLDFGAGALPVVGGEDVFVVKLDPAGNVLWSRGFGSAGDDEIGEMAIDAAGNIYLWGTFKGSIDLGTGPIDGNATQAPFLVKLAPTGTTLAARALNGRADVGGIALDGAGGVIVVGSYYGTFDAGGAAFTNTDGYTNAFIAKLDGSLGHVWSKSFGGSNWDFANDVAVDTAGNLLITGSFHTTIDFGGGPLTSSSSNGQSYLVKLTASGEHVWSKAFDDTSTGAGFRLAADPAGGVFMAGFETGAADLGNGPLADSGLEDGVLARFDASGNALWSKRFGTGAHDFLTGLASTSTGDVVVAGYFDGAIGPDFGSGPLTGLKAGRSPVVARLTPDGALVWAASVPSSYFTRVYDVALGPQGTVLVTGSTQGGVDFGSGQLGFFSESNMFVFTRGL